MLEIKAIIFDWGGVMIDNPGPGMVRYFADAMTVSVDDYLKAHNRFIEDFETARLTEDQFWDNICNELSVQRPHIKDLWITAFKEVYSPKKEMFALAAALRKNHYKTALLSNTEPPSIEFFRPDYEGRFDALIFSCTEKIRKPHKEIFELALRKLNIHPQEAIFIDDRVEHIRGAQKSGLHAILFDDPPKLKAHLESLGVKTNG